MNHQFTQPSEARLLTDRLRNSVPHGARFDKQQSISDRDGNLQMVIEGGVVRERMLADGRCQAVAIYFRDDVINLGRFVQRDENRDNLTALKGTVMASVEPSQVQVFRGMSNSGVDGMSGLVLRELSITQERLTCIGQRTALESMAHFMCEALVRSRARLEEKRCALAVTQDMLGELLGLSSVHVNRTLQVIRSMKLADIVNGELTVHQFDRLAELGEFDGGYLAPV